MISLLRKAAASTIRSRRPNFCQTNHRMTTTTNMESNKQTTLETQPFNDGEDDSNHMGTAQLFYSYAGTAIACKLASEMWFSNAKSKANEAEMHNHELEATSEEELEDLRRQSKLLEEIKVEQRSKLHLVSQMSMKRKNEELLKLEERTKRKMEELELKKGMKR